ncbi:hypothetical protein EYF80_028687 [Liparis tanakae]|uniref:Uncharacterized protein n=1 Tax=Liparis tanakae TaxID=230148 RepID=A0A4Z2H856_9TELE|nr:hypothetical protein EYF80_028687 [Liparis tanakae]
MDVLLRIRYDNNVKARLQATCSWSVSEVREAKSRPFLSTTTEPKVFVWSSGSARGPDRGPDDDLELGVSDSSRPLS